MLRFLAESGGKVNASASYSHGCNPIRPRVWSKTMFAWTALKTDTLAALLRVLLAKRETPPATPTRR